MPIILCIDLLRSIVGLPTIGRGAARLCGEWKRALLFFGSIFVPSCRRASGKLMRVSIAARGVVLQKRHWTKRPSCENFRLIAKAKIIWLNMARAVIVLALPPIEIREPVFGSNYITSAVIGRSTFGNGYAAYGVI